MVRVIEVRKWKKNSGENGKKLQSGHKECACALITGEEKGCRTDKSATALFVKKNRYCLFDFSSCSSRKRMRSFISACILALSA